MPYFGDYRLVGPWGEPLPLAPNLPPYPTHENMIVYPSIQDVPPPEPYQLNPSKPVQARPDPVYSPVSITPYPRSETQQAYGELQPPRIQDFEPSRKRTILASIAGGLAGAAAGPVAGYQLGQQFRYGPYFQAQRDYAQQAEKLAQQGKFEKEQFDRAAEEAKLGMTKYTAEMGQLSKQEKLDLEERKLQQNYEYMQARIRNLDSSVLRRASLMKKDEAEAFLKWSKDYISRHIEASKRGDTEEMDRIEDAVKMYRSASHMTPEERKAATIAIEEGRTEHRTGQAYQGLQRATTASRKQGELDIASSQQALDLKRELGKIGIETKQMLTDEDQKALDTLLTMAVKDPDQGWQLFKTGGFSPNVKRAFLANVPPGTLGRVLSPQQDNIVRASLVVRRHGARALNIIESYNLWDKLGPAIGRYNRVTRDFGEIPFTDERTREGVSHLRSSLGYLAAFENVLNTMGNPGIKMLQYIEGLTPGLQMSKPEFMGAMQGVIRAAEDNLASVELPTRRGMPYEPTAPTPAAPPNPNPRVPQQTRPVAPPGVPPPGRRGEIIR